MWFTCVYEISRGSQFGGNTETPFAWYFQWQDLREQVYIIGKKGILE